MASTVGYLLDTTVVIHLLRNDHLGQQIDARFNLRASLASSMVCVVTIGELRAFARKRGWGQKRLDDLQKVIDELVWIDINRREVIEAYGEIDYYSEKTVNPARRMGKNDVWIAATAKATGATLLTIDKDFDHLVGTHIDCVRIDADSKRP